MMKITASKRTTFLFLTMMLLAAACNPFTIITRSSDTGGWVDWDGSGGWSESGGRGGFEGGEGIALAEESAPLGKGFSSADSEPVMPPVPGDEVVTSNQNPGLRAGSVDDNLKWDDYLLYRIRFADWGIPVHDVDVTERHIIKVANESGLPVHGARVKIMDDQGKEVAEMLTHSDGTALFFPLASSEPESDTYLVTVEKDGKSAELIIERSTREHSIILDADSTNRPIRLDVLFLIDATGSMSDEIQKLKDNMIRISERINNLPGDPDVRFGMTIYRDRGDLFVSRTFDFTPDVDAFTSEMRDVIAEGGGDYPESLNEGLHDAIHLPEWRIEDTVSLIFLVADAPPHLDYSQDDDYAKDVYEANERGIKIYPLASSGLDDQGEYIFRQLAQITSGKFLFLTYGPDGAPGDDTTHHVDDYSVLSLDDLVVRLIEEELDNLSGGQ